MTLYSDVFYSSKINFLLSAESAIARMLKVEAALTRSQAKLTLVPSQASQVIGESCHIHLYDIERLKLDIRLGANAAIPLVKQLVHTVKNVDFEASKYVHLGATSQDIVDTSLVLAIKEYTDWLEEKMDELASLLHTLTYEHRSTVMIGRTLLQQAKPITFGLKTAGWLQGVLDAKERLSESKKRVQQIQLAGAVGSASSFLSKEVRDHFAMALGLENRGSWQVNRGNLVEWLSSLSIFAVHVGKVAKDISLMMQTEIGEVLEGAAKGKGGSSTMPHKRNPVACSLLIANAHRVPHLVASVMSGMVQEHERSAGLWHAEWEPTEQIMGLAAGSLEQCIDLIENLEVNPEKMLANLEVTNGLIYAENVSLALSPVMGKSDAHEWVEMACERAVKEKKHLRAILEEADMEMSDLESLFNPENSIGNSFEFIDQTLKNYENQL